MGTIHGVILHYSKSDSMKHNAQYVPYDQNYIEQRYKHSDPGGRRWVDDNLTGKGLRGGEYNYEYRGVYSLWRVPLQTMGRLDREELSGSSG